MTRTLLLATAVLGLFHDGEALAAIRTVSRPQAAAPLEFPFEARGVYDILTAPGRITDIALEPGERLVDTNPIAAGDTARWVIGDTSSGEGISRRVHVLIKPTASSLATNLIINTDRRTYFLDIRASGQAYLTQVSWRYPDTTKPVVVVAAPIMCPPTPVRLNFAYVVRGSRSLRPLQVFDDGARVVIVFDDRLRLEDLPPLYRIGPDGKTAELINYRVEGRSLVVDRLFDEAELRLGAKRWSARLRIKRVAPASEAVR